MQIWTANLQGIHANLHVLQANLYSYFGYANLQCVVLFFLNIYNKKDVQKSKKLRMQICNVPIPICKLTVQICIANLHPPLQKGCKICIRFAYLIYVPSVFLSVFSKYINFLKTFFHKFCLKVSGQSKLLHTNFNSYFMKSCCPLCKAEGSGPNTFKNFLPTAPWHDTEWTATTWRASDQRTKSKIFDLEHLNCWSVCLDLMHCRYLGTDQHQYASVLYLLVFEMMPHEPLQNLQQLWKEIKDLYRDLGVKNQYNFFGKISMFYKKSGECRLRGKASEVRFIGSVLQVLWERRRNAELEIHRMISCMLKLNTQLETILQDHKGCNALPPEEAAVFEQSCQKMCHLQCLLYDHFCNEENTPRLFPVTAKLHALVHISKLSRYISPHKVGCFAGEDFMHVCKILCKQCVHGTKPQLPPAKMVGKFRLAMHYELAS